MILSVYTHLFCTVPSRACTCTYGIVSQLFRDDSNEMKWSMNAKTSGRKLSIESIHIEKLRVDVVWRNVFIFQAKPKLLRLRTGNIPVQIRISFVSNTEKYAFLPVFPSTKVLAW